MIRSSAKTLRNVLVRNFIQNHPISLTLSVEVEGTPGPSTVVFAQVTVSKFYMKGQLRCEH